jgi:cardiolipin synthase A/B
VATRACSEHCPLAAFFAFLHAVAAAIGTVHALTYKRDPRAAAGWVAVCIFVPFAGPLGYYVLGINRVRTRARSLKHSRVAVAYERGAPQAHPRVTHHDPLLAIGDKLTPFPLRPGHAMTILSNGEQAYPAMLDAIDNARERLLLATYIFNVDSVGKRLIEALANAANRGVDVRVLVDGIGELYSRKRASRELRRHGVATARFLPPTLLPPSVHVNLRNHRKVMVVDGERAFVGGMNISEKHVAIDGVRDVDDVHFEIRGPIAHDLERVALHDWAFATGTIADHVAPLRSTPCGDVACRVISDGPDEELDRLALTIQSVISAAERRVDIMTPYFLPSRELIAALLSAALRGVRVRIVLPERSNLLYVDWATRNFLGELLAFDIEIHYQPRPFCHSKLLGIDADYYLVGSANLDPRSLRLNFEVGVEVWSGSLCTELARYYDGVVARSRRIDSDAMDRRPLPHRIRDSAAALLSPYL